MRLPDMINIGLEKLGYKLSYCLLPPPILDIFNKNCGKKKPRYKNAEQEPAKCPKTCYYSI